MRAHPDICLEQIVLTVVVVNPRIVEEHVSAEHA
jgi:hypothetical protein